MEKGRTCSHQAILVLAHKNINQVIKLAEYLLTVFNVYVHFDTKVNLSSDQLNKIQALEENKDGNLFRSISVYDVKWGSYSIVRATIALMKLAYHDTQNQYFHLISGQDWPLKPLTDIYDFYDGKDIVYMYHYLTETVVKNHEPEIWWVKYYFNYDQINRRTLFGKIYHRFLLLAQTILRVNKLRNTKWDIDHMYAGKEWIDIPRNALGYALKMYDSDHELQHIFATSFCSDEMWLQTILCNSDQYKGKISNDIHRFIPEVKKNGHGETPDILTKKYYDQIEKGNAFWGRKFVSPNSDLLMKMLQKENVN